MTSTSSLSADKAKQGVKELAPPIGGQHQRWSSKGGLCSTLRDFFGHECLPDTTFLWPALQLSASELWELTDVTPFDASKPMSRSRFLELLRGAIGEMGTPQQDAACAGYNRLRRFMPTLGNCLRLPRTEMQALGSGVEIPSGGGPQATKKEKAVMDMGFHYAGQKVVRSAQIKGAILHRFFSLYRIKSPEFALSGTGLMKFDAWTWPELCSMGDVLSIPQFEVPAEDLAAQIPVDEHPPAVRVRHVDPVDSSDSEGVGQAQVEKVASSGSDDDDSSSSASDVSAVAEELDGVMHEESFHSNMKWIQQGKKIHIVKAVPHEGRQVPWCRDFPFAQEPARAGEGFDQVSKGEFCQRCLARLPRAIYTALAEHCAWMHWLAKVVMENGGLSCWGWGFPLLVFPVFPLVVFLFGGGPHSFLCWCLPVVCVVISGNAAQEVQVT